MNNGTQNTAVPEQQPVRLTMNIVKKKDIPALISRHRPDGDRFDALKDRVMLELRQGTFDYGDAAAFEIERLPNGEANKADIAAIYQSLRTYFHKNRVPLMVSTSVKKSIILVRRKES